MLPYDIEDKYQIVKCFIVLMLVYCINAVGYKYSNPNFYNFQKDEYAYQSDYAVQTQGDILNSMHLLPLKQFLINIYFYFIFYVFYTKSTALIYIK